MAWSVLHMVLGVCLFVLSYGDENESQTGLQRTELVPGSGTGPGAIHHNEVAKLGLKLKYQNQNDILKDYRPRLRRYAEKKKRKHNSGAFSPISSTKQQDVKKANNTRTRREGSSKGKRIKLVKQLLKHHELRNQQMSPTKKAKVPERKKIKKPGIFSVLSYTAQDKERSGGQKEDMDD